jgi:pSer/pThr/pTyr-binding forkhead associated (FHA) protein
MSERRCPSCGAVVPARHQYCGRCGAPVRGPGGSLPSGSDTLFFGPLQTPGRAKLIVIRGDGAEGISYALNATVHAAGRSSGVILFPDDETLSAEHATFRYRDDKLYLTDLQSLNGTFLRIRTPHTLSDGDLFSAGQQRFRVDRLRDETEFPTDDGTLCYVSPPRPEHIRVLQILDGGIPGQAVASPVDEITIGREGCDLTVADDPYLSRRHCKVSLDRHGRIELSDLGSRNGTFVRIGGEVGLVHGDYVFLGRELLRVEIIE